MHNILVAGAGKIGRLIACLLAESSAYQVVLSDIEPSTLNEEQLGNQANTIKVIQLDATDEAAVLKAHDTHQFQAVISSLPYFCNEPLAKVCHKLGLHYFDLTEDVEVTHQIEALAKGAKSAFVPQCGLAPGFISIVANDLMQGFDEFDAVLMRVGALPEHPHNALKYSLTWSTDGLINEYGNLCYGIHEGKEVPLIPLEGLETIEIDGLLYEAFNTSGGLGSLAKTYQNRVNTMNYKTLRYPGHCKQMRLLMNDLKLNQDRDTLKRILENAVPKTYQDVVIIYVAVRGMQNGQLLEKNYVKKIYPCEVAGKRWSAIQITTAGSVCAIADIVLTNVGDYQGLVLQEDFVLKDVLENRFGHYYA